MILSCWKSTYGMLSLENIIPDIEPDEKTVVLSTFFSVKS